MTPNSGDLFFWPSIKFGDKISLKSGKRPFWDFRDASRWKSLCFFCAKLRIRQPEIKNAITLKRLKVETWNLELRCGTYESLLVQILGAIGFVILVSEPRTEMPIEGLNSSSSKTNRRRRIKVSNWEAPGRAVSAPKIKIWRFQHFFIYLSTFFIDTTTPKPPKLETWNLEMW